MATRSGEECSLQLQMSSKQDNSEGKQRGAMATNLEEQLVLGDALDWFEKVSSKRKLVVEASLALLEKGICVSHLSPQLLTLGFVLAVQ